jgi:hypothetical protein
MRVERTTEEMLANYIDGMGQQLGELFNAASTELSLINWRWNQYRILFGDEKPPGRIDFLNEAAPFFFRMVHDVLFEDAVLATARIVAPPESVGKPSLTIRRFPKLITRPDLRAQVLALVEAARQASHFSLDWRHRHLAHRDLGLALQHENVRTLSAVTPQQVEEALSAIRDVLDCIEVAYTGSQTAYSFCSVPGDAGQLLYVLQGGILRERDRHACWDRGERHPDDLNPLPRSDLSLRNDRMFESICVGRHDFLGGGVDFGRLAEALVFYQRVHFLAEEETFKSLIRTCGTDVVLELCHMGRLTIHFAENMPAAATRDLDTPMERHGLITAKVQNHNFLTQATKFFEEYCGPSGKGFNKILTQFSRSVQTFEHPKSVLEHVQSDLADRGYVRASVQGLLSALAPEYQQPNPLVFDVTLGSDEHLRVDANIDFRAANESYHRRISPEHSSLSRAAILAHLLTTRSNLEVASDISGDLALGPVSSIIGANKIAKVVEAHEKNRDALDRFVDFAVDDSRAIGQAISNRERNFSDVLKLVQEAQKFKEWLKKQDESADLCKEYCREVSRVDWADKLPPKTFRMLLFNAAGLAISASTSPIGGVAAGLGLSLADNFLLDKLLKGWRPDQFVNGPLRDFIKTGR